MSIANQIKNDPNISPEFKKIFDFENPIFGETKAEIKQAERLDDIKERYSHHTVKELIECLHLTTEIDEIHSKILEDMQYYLEYPSKWKSDHNESFDQYIKYLKAYIIEEYA